MIQRVVVNEYTEEGKDVKEMSLSNAEQLSSMRQAPMAKFVTKHCFDLFRLTLFDERVVNNDVLLPWQAEEVSIAVCASFAAVDGEEVGEREVEFLRKLLDSVSKLSWFEGRQLVEQRLDEDGVDRDTEYLHGDCEHPEVIEELCACRLDDLEKAGKNWCTKCDHQTLRFEHIHEEETLRLLVEAELLFKNKSAIVRRWQRQDLRNEVECKEEQDRV